VTPARIQALAEKLANSMVSRSYFPTLWKIYFDQFLEVLTKEFKKL
jgi:hypothetical protein